jgi:hypothetical protein
VTIVASCSGRKPFMASDPPGGLEALGVVVVLDEDGDAVDGPLVVGLDAGEVALDDGATGSAALEERGLGLGKGGADGVEAGRLGVVLGLGVRGRKRGGGD